MQQSLVPVAQGFSPANATRARAKAGWCLVLACLTRYEAWLVTAAVLVLATVALWRRGLSPAAALKATAHLAIYPVLAIVAFFFHSWFTTGAWFVTGGFFVPDNVATGSVWSAFMAVVYGMRTLIGTPLVLLALAGVLLVLWRGLSRAEHAASLVVLALVALMALPAYAFFNGHPFRMRYMVAPSVGAAVFAGIAHRHDERPLAPRRGRCDRRVARRDREAHRCAGADGAGSAVGCARSASAGGT